MNDPDLSLQWGDYELEYVTYKDCSSLPGKIYESVDVVVVKRKAGAQRWYVKRLALPGAGIVPGSMARDVLAAERTFLAWARTGLGFVGAGSALVAAWHEQEQNVAPSAMILIANGGFLLAFATRRYLRVLQSLQKNTFPLDTNGTLSTIFVTAVGTSTALGLVARTKFQSRWQRDDEEKSSK